MERSPGTSDNAPTADTSAELRVAPSAPVAKPKPPKKRTTVTFYLSDAMRNRARAAYRQTSFDERDSSWSEMLNKALLAEVRRRELEYNSGKAFIGNDEPLTPGRPIGF